MAHLTDMPGYRPPTAVSLFAGCGGMDLGFKLAGFRTVWANEIDRNARATFEWNLGLRPDPRDIRDIPADEVPDADVIIGGPPCQDFSVIRGKRRKGIKGPRGMLFDEYLRIVGGKRPLAFIAENVKGMLSSDKGEAWSYLKGQVSDAGYRLYWSVVDFSTLGVPQKRQRVIMVGVRKDLKWTYVPPGIQPNVHVGPAIAHSRKHLFNNRVANMSEKNRKLLNLVPEGGNWKDLPEDHPHRPKACFSNLMRRLHRDQYAYTLTAGGGGWCHMYHPTANRELTNRERADIQSFPRWWVFMGSYTSVRRQLGNAVPPAGIKCVARAVRNMMLAGAKYGEV